MCRFDVASGPLKYFEEIFQHLKKKSLASLLNVVVVYSNAKT